MTVPTRICTCLWFECDGEKAAGFCVSLLAGSRITGNLPAGPRGFDSVTVADPQEADRLWHALVADGGQESRCSWLVDRFGVSWQVLPAARMHMRTDPDRAAAARATQAMMGMTRIDVGTIESALRGKR